MFFNSPYGLFTFGAEDELDTCTSTHSDSQEREEQIDCGMNEGDGIVALGTAGLSGFLVTDTFQAVKKLTKHGRLERQLNCMVTLTSPWNHKQNSNSAC